MKCSDKFNTSVMSDGFIPYTEIQFSAFSVSCLVCVCGAWTLICNNAQAAGVTTAQFNVSSPGQWRKRSRLFIQSFPLIGGLGSFKGGRGGYAVRPKGQWAGEVCLISHGRKSDRCVREVLLILKKRKEGCVGQKDRVRCSRSHTCWPCVCWWMRVWVCQTVVYISRL